MSKEKKNDLVKFDTDVKEVVMQGAELLYKAVSVTLGAGGRNVIIKDGFNGVPQVTKDGVTVAGKVDNPDLMIKGAIEVIRSAAEKTNDEEGDGTTSSIVLAYNMLKESFNVVEKKWWKPSVNSVMFKKGIDRALEVVLAELDKMARMDFETYDVASVSANGDAEMARLISEAFKTVGEDGMVGFEASLTNDSFTTRDEGLKFNTGFPSDYFITNPQKRIAQYKDSLLLVVDAELEKMDNIVYYAMAAEKSRKPLVVIAHKFGQEVINSFAKSKVEKGFQTILIEAPFYAEERSSILKDIGVMTGSTVLTERAGNINRLGIKGKGNDDRANSALRNMGHANKIIASKDSTSIYYEINQDYVDGLLETYKETGDESFRERAARLTGGVAIINVGGNSEAEVKERLDRVEDAVNATRTSLKNGVVAGGGTALLKARKAISWLKFLTADEKKGADALYRAMASPSKKILDNAELKDMTYGKYPNWVDARTGKVENFFDSGIIDPVNVVKSSLKNAVSVASTLSTSGAYVLIVR